MSSPTPGDGADAAEGTALVVVATGLLAVSGPVAIQVLWLIAAVAATVAAAVGRARGPRPPAGGP